MKTTNGHSQPDMTIEETLMIANKISKALSIIDKEPVTVNMDTLESASFDLDWNGSEFDGGSYIITNSGNIRNMAMRGDIYGHIDI